MAISARISGDYSNYVKDFSRLGKYIKPKSRYEFGLIIGKTSDFYVKTFNNFMNMENHRSLARARRTKVSSGGRDYDVTKVIVPKKAIDFDTGPMRKISISNPAIKLWTIKHWKQARIKGRNRWYAGQIWAGQSKVYGRRNNPKGYLIVMSYKDKHGMSIQEETERKTFQYHDSLLRYNSDIINRIFERKSFKRMYNLRIDFNLS